MSQQENQTQSNPVNGNKVQLPPFVFENESGNTIFKDNPTPVWHFILTKVSAPPEGGIFRHHKDCKYPAKGLPFFEAIMAMDLVKKYTMSVVYPLASKDMILPLLAFALIRRKKKLRMGQLILERYAIFANHCFRGVYLKPRYYGRCPKAIRQFVAVFLREIGINEENSVELKELGMKKLGNHIDLAENIGKVVASFIEYDDAYRYRLEDALSEFTKEEIYKNPRKAMKKFAQIFRERDKQVGFKFISFAKLFGLAFLFPSIKRAFRKALDSIDFADLQLDDADRYYCHLRTGYNFFGLTDQERIDKWYEIHDGNIPDQIEILS